MDYQVVYDASTVAPDWGFALFGVPFIAIGVLMLLFRNTVARITRRSPTYVTVFGAIFLAFSSLWTLLAGVMTSGPSAATKSAAKDGTTTVVEGQVEDFKPAPYVGHQNEEFRVGDVHFSYSDYMITGGFNQTQSHGGPIRQGLRVRIHYVGSRQGPIMVKIEAKR